VLTAGVVAFHGPMLDRRLGLGAAGYDGASFIRALCHTAPLGELAPDGLEVLRRGDASGTLLGGTLTQLLATLGTPYAFDPPDGYVLLLDEVGERPYRLDRMLTQARQARLLARARAIIIGELPNCDEPNDGLSGRAVMADLLAAFPGPVVFGFPTGHTAGPTMTLPLGVTCRVIAEPRPRIVIEEAAVED
jgi:muramoyltetrapeptide carboxypeptidase